MVGLPDTIWYPPKALVGLPCDEFSLLLFPVERPEFFDVVVTGEDSWVREIQVKPVVARSGWIWGAMKMPGAILEQLHVLWVERDRTDEFMGTLINAWLARGDRVRGIPTGERYVDVGTLHGYREAMKMLSQQP